MTLRSTCKTRMKNNRMGLRSTGSTTKQQIQVSTFNNMKQRSCFFTEETIDGEGLYQICSCKRHAWSSRAQRMMAMTDDGSFLFSDSTGSRYKFFPDHKKRGHCYYMQWIVQAAFVLVLYVFVYNHVVKHNILPISSNGFHSSDM